MASAGPFMANSVRGTQMSLSSFGDPAILGKWTASLKVQSDLVLSGDSSHSASKTLTPKLRSKWLNESSMTTLGTKAVKFQERRRSGFCCRVKSSPGIEAEMPSVEKFSNNAGANKSGGGAVPVDRVSDGNAEIKAGVSEKGIRPPTGEEDFVRELLEKANFLTKVESRPAELSLLTELLNRLENEPSKLPSTSDIASLSAMVASLGEKSVASPVSDRLQQNSSSKGSGIMAAKNTVNDIQLGSAASSNSASRSVQRIAVADAASGWRSNGTAQSTDDVKAAPVLVDQTELIALRRRLNTKLSEANAYNRHLQRELQQREEALNTYKSELASMEAELKALAALAKDVAMQGSKASTMKINGRFVYSHMAFKLEELHNTMKGHTTGVDALYLRDVAVEWYGMAEDVKVMGSFDNWLYGEQMSPESTGTYTRFTATLKLRPGRYELKFLVDGEWRIAPGWETVGSGLSANNLLVVE